MDEQEILRHRLERTIAPVEDILRDLKAEPLMTIDELVELGARRAAVLSILARARQLDGLALT